MSQVLNELRRLQLLQIPDRQVLARTLYHHVSDAVVSIPDLCLTVGWPLDTVRTDDDERNPEMMLKVLKSVVTGRYSHTLGLGGTAGNLEYRMFETWGF